MAVIGSLMLKEASKELQDTEKSLVSGLGDTEAEDQAAFITADTSYRSLAAMYSVSTVLYNTQLNTSMSYINTSKIAKIYGSQFGLDRQTSINIAKAYNYENFKQNSKIY